MTARARIFFLSFWLLAGCGSYQPPKVPFVQPIAEDDEVKISREFRKEAKKSLKLVSDVEVQRYIDAIGHRILSVMGPQPFDYRYFVVDEPVLNAFAVPGGSIYLYAGLLDRVKNRDELAAVMAHETIHIKDRDMARMSGLDPASLLGILGAVLAARSGAGGQAAAAVGQGIAATRQIAYTRQLEMKADTLGVRYMAEAGFDPRAAVSFLKALYQEQMLNPVDVPPYLIDHPLSQDRIANAELLIRSLKPRRPSSEEPDPIKKVQTLLRLERHESDAVIAEYEKQLTQNPDNWEAMQLLGVAHFYNQRWAKAREYYERARAANARAPGIDRDLGRVYTQLGEFQPAHAAFDRALESEPKESLNYLFLGELYERESKLPEAVDAYLQATQLSPNWEVPARHLGEAYGKLNRLGDAYYYLGHAHLLADEDEMAIADLERALKYIAPTTPRGLMVKEELDRIKARRR